MVLNNLHYKKIRGILTLFASILFSLIFFLCIDYLYSYINKLNRISTPYLSLDNGFYELKKNYDGSENFGNISFRVQTDSLGNRKKPDSKDIESPTFLFLGDSFTYGINGPWEETFVGQFSLRFPQTVNSGVSSYSPTLYLHRYKYLRSHYKSKNLTIIVGVDISDIQDEASFWRDGLNHPVKSQEELSYKMQSHPTSQTKNLAIRGWLQENFFLTKSIYRLFRNNNFQGDDLYLIRGGFTWMDWSNINSNPGWINFSGYAPLGVEGGLNKTNLKLNALVKLAHKNNDKVYFLIYPWPLQLLNTDKFSWEKFINNACLQSKCDGVINTFPLFREYASKNVNWRDKLYLQGDIHLNNDGNQIISRQLIQQFAH